MTFFTKSLPAIALVLPGLALAQVGVGDTLSTTEADIKAMLEADGYEIRHIETEDDEIEIEAVFEGQALEIEVSLQTGMVTEIELDDDDS